ncbi:uncharacterized protein [Clytia hemisphaerica]|uniref:Integrase catalytic domain-containing protein n=1 Tax=Clytia hemisphaerica TaxID=252671 RepID=A0A7M5WMD4_9CNID
MSETEDDKTLRLARRKRNGKKSTCHHYIDDIEKHLSQLDQLEESKQVTVLGALKTLRDSLVDLKSEFLALDMEYLNLLESDDDYDHAYGESSQLQAKIDVTTGSVTNLLDSLKSKASNTSISSHEHKVPISVKLPKLEIKKFSGNPSQWRSFWDSFQAAVGKHSYIEDVQKFNFLKGLLEGRAAMAISGLELSDKNYKEAVSLLSDRFGSKQVVITHHMDTLLQILPVKAGTDVKQLRAVYDKIEINVRGLQSLGIKPDQYGCLLVPVIMSKVPEDIRLIILRQFSSENWTFEVLLKCFKQELEAREKCEAVSKSSKSKEPPADKGSGKGNKGSEGSQNGGGGGSSRNLLNPTGRQDNKIRCSYCRGEHSSAKCDIVQDVNTRWKYVKRNHLCFNCLAKNHGLKECTKRSCRNCEEKHHESLCQGTPSTGLIARAKKLTLLQTAKVKVYHPNDNNQVSKVRIVFDMGSNDSYITKSIKDKLKLPNLGKHKMVISGFGGSSKGSKEYDMTALNLKSRFGGGSFPLSALVVPTITSSPLNPSVEFQHHEHLASLDLADDFTTPQEEICVLIGVDQYHRFVSGETVRRSSGPVATKSVFGWLVSGPIEGTSSSFSNSLLLSSQTPSIDERLSRFWDLESMGIVDESIEDEVMTKEFKDSIVHNGERYEVPLPRKDVHPDLQDNFSVAKQRLFGLKKKFNHNPDLKAQYNQYFEDQLEQNIIEKVDTKDHGKQGWTHYLPHHCVIREERETTKMRIVFDASCQSNDNPSLNQCLETGPSLNPELFDILLRFRLFPIALVSDIEKAFHMISVRPEDRDVLRFVWFDPKDNNKLVTYRQKRVLMGLNASPFILTATVQNHLEKQKGNDSKYRSLVEGITNSLYVDDLCTGEFDEEAAFQFFKDSKKLMEEGQFNLRKWKTSSSGVSEKMVKEGETLGSDDCKVLGIPWNPRSDVFFFSLHEFASKFLDMVVTKRNVVSVVAQLFDPLGLLSPVFITAKVLLQKIHKSSSDWDKVVEKDLQDEWKDWLNLLIEIGSVKIQRFYFFGLDSFSRESLIELHGFSDASAVAYGAVVYVVEKSSRRAVTVTSKTRVSPLKETSIPRLELLGAYILSVLIQRVEQAMSTMVNVDSIHCWTDSMVVLYWLDSGKELKQFVRNRVKKIKKHTQEGIWRHCPGKENPSDMTSRGVSSKEEFEEGLWFRGPEWLSKDPEHWPKQKLEVDMSVKEKAMKEVKVSKVLLARVTTVQLIEFQRFSEFKSLIRSVAWAIRFCHNFEVYHGSRLSLGQLRKGPLTVDELKKAELDVLHQAQNQLSDDRLKELERSLSVRLNVDGLLETVGRLEEASSCNRILIPRDSHVSALIILRAHQKVKHSGVAATLAEVRSRFWIPQGRQFVKKILKNCIVCKKLNSKSFSTIEGLLPEFRIDKNVTGFEHVGLDYLGPLYVVEKSSSTSVEKKVWVALFTCATTRAVHLELVNDMTTDCFLNSFRRFCARRGIPSFIVSDNAKTFKAADKYLLKLSKESEVLDYFSSLKITWHFILEKSPWWGGFWERMVKLTKSSLKKTLGKVNVSFEGLHTILTEIEAVLNCRPLTYVGADDEIECLTPSHLICGKRIISLPTGQVVKTLEESYQHVKKCFEDARERWYREYLTELRVHHKKVKKFETPKVGSLVLVKDENKKRQLWNVGKIENLIFGRKNVVRGALISFGIEGKHKVKRPLELLYPLEVHGWDSFHFSGQETSTGLPNEMQQSKNHVSVEKESQPIIPAVVQNLVFSPKHHTSISSKPSIVASFEPSIVATSGPSVPVVSGLSVPVVPGPSVPAVSGLSVPVVSGPSVPVVSGPSVPVVSGLSVPVVSGPSVPAVSGPSVPAVSGPSVPVVSDLSVPVVSGPSVPVVSGPSVPAVSGLSVPVVFGLSVPVVSGPSVPVVSGPSAPVVSGPPVPVVSDPLIPVASGLSNCYQYNQDELIALPRIPKRELRTISTGPSTCKPVHTTRTTSNEQQLSNSKTKLNPLAKTYNLRSLRSKTSSSGV